MRLRSCRHRLNRRRRLASINPLAAALDVVPQGRMIEWIEDAERPRALTGLA